MTQLSRLETLGLAKEVTAGTYLVPTASIPFLKADFEDTTVKIEDKSYRNNDTELQGLYPGPQDAVWDIDVLAYPDLIGHFLRGIIGPDTVTAPTATTLAAAVSSLGATSISTTASIPLGSTISIDTGANIEYATTGTPTGSGPYTIPIVTPAGGLTKTHLISVAVSTTTVHTFKQNPTAAKATYSLTVYDTLNYIGYSAATFSDLQVKIDPKGAMSFNCKLKAMPGVSQSSFVPAYTNLDPLLGWSWNMTNAGAASTRGLTYDVTVKRVADPVHSSDGIQAPREIFQGALAADGTYKAIFENQTDLNLFANYSQQPVTATLTQPISRGGMSLALTTSKTGVHKGKRSYGSSYVQADFSMSAIYNSTDSGAVSAVLTNFTTTQY